MYQVILSVWWWNIIFPHHSTSVVSGSYPKTHYLDLCGSHSHFTEAGPQKMPISSCSAPADCLWCPYTATDKLRWECPSPWLHHGVPSWTHGDVWMQIPKKKRGLGIPGIGGFYPNGNRVATQGYTKIYRSNHSKCNWQRNNISTVSERLARPFQNCLVNKESTMDYDTGLWKWIIKVYKDHDIPQYIG